MDIFLRKASSLDKAATAAASKIEIETTIKLSIHALRTNLSMTDTEQLLAKAAATASERIEDAIALYNAASQIRRLAKVANSKKVDALLCEKQNLDSLDKMITAVLDATKKITSGRRRTFAMDGEDVKIGYDPEVLLNVVNSLRNRVSATTNGSIPDIEVSAMPTSAIKQLEGRLASIKRRRTDLMDELGAENLKEKITLPESVVTTLRKHGIIE